MNLPMHIKKAQPRAYLMNSNNCGEEKKSEAGSARPGIILL